jgi:hypothetical protein
MIPFCPCRPCTIGRLTGIRGLLGKDKVDLAMAALDGVIADLNRVSPRLLAEVHQRHQPDPASPLVKLERAAAARKAEAARAASTPPPASPGGRAQAPGRTARKAAPKKPNNPSTTTQSARARWLDERLQADPGLVDRVAQVLRIRAADVRAVAAGRLRLAPSAWKRLVAELEEDAGS